ncbi:sterol desaturase family protein [Candidatus Gracilibacteria bacterium]|nr:sterol desaturase family protein [Candidatus Gracilibacteria bacterium]
MLENLYLINLGAFVGGIIIFGISEYFFRYRMPTDSTGSRWGENFSMTIVNTLIIRFLFFVTPISVVLYAADNNLGIFNYFDIPEFFAGIFMFLLLDMIIFLEHIMFHKIPFFWKFHSVHHSDLDMDFTTALRFHFGEAIFSSLTKILFIITFGPPVWSVIAFEVVLNVSAMWNHSNINLPKKLDRLVSKIIVTPKFHEVHHSQDLSESMSNYGFFLSIWDYMYKTYVPHQRKIAKLGMKNQNKRYNLKKLLLLKTDK